MNKWALIGGAPLALYALGYGVRRMTWDYKNFSPDEFGLWLPFINSGWLEKADTLRETVGYPINVSPSRDAMGRVSGEDEEGFFSQHNLLLHGVVNAIDVFPGVAPLTPDALADFVKAAKQVGFTGIGIYPHTQFRGRRWPMVHLDVRPDGLATWGRTGGGAFPQKKRQYIGMEDAFSIYRSESSGLA